jgi:hypothetical protein
MGGLFGVVSKNDCVADLFYGTDYHSHLGTRRGGMVVQGPRGFVRSIHDISNTQFRSKFESDLAARQAITRLEGEDAPLADYSDASSERYGRMLEEIGKQLGLTTLRYQKLDDMVAAIGLPREKLCTYCWNGCQSASEARSQEPT